MGNNKLSL